MVSSNHQFISLLSCSCLVLATVPVASFRGSSSFLFRPRPPSQPFHDVLQPILGRSPASGTLLYSTNPTGRKRRRRKEASDDNNASDTDRSTTTENGRINELPDFDINDDEVIASSAAATTKNTGAVVDPLIGTITSNMMASTPAATATNRAVTSSILSVNELRDRSLEQKLEILYDETEKPTEDLPDLLTLQKERKKVTTEQIILSASSMSKKERQTLARQQQDMEQEQSKKAMLNAQETDDNLFSKLPFITNDETGKVEPLKLLEAATWTCIIALVLWEVYINSPFFSRAAPIIPIVYEIWI